MEISNLHYLVDDPQLVSFAVVRGVNWVQLRVKDKPYAEWKQLALATQAACAERATLIINDNPQLALEVGAHGVHLGQQDMPPAEARALLGPEFIIGGTANTFADIERLVAAGVNYIGLGPFQFTTTKQNLSPVLGLTGYTELLAQCRAAGFTVPIVGIGGILLDDVAPLMATGLHGVAVSKGISAVKNRTKNVWDFVSRVNNPTLKL
jgi:thiamine-phosphate pyrophosphorylase